MEAGVILGGYGFSLMIEGSLIAQWRTGTFLYLGDSFLPKIFHYNVL